MRRGWMILGVLAVAAMMTSGADAAFSFFTDPFDYSDGDLEVESGGVWVLSPTDTYGNNLEVNSAGPAGSPSGNPVVGTTVGVGRIGDARNIGTAGSATDSWVAGVSCLWTGADASGNDDMSVQLRAGTGNSFPDDSGPILVGIGAIDGRFGASIAGVGETKLDLMPSDIWYHFEIRGTGTAGGDTVVEAVYRVGNDPTENIIVTGITATGQLSTSFDNVFIVDGRGDTDDLVAYLDDAFFTEAGVDISTADFDANGVIDDVDLTILANHWQQAGVFADGDADGSGFIDDVDLTALALVWPAGNLDASAVPEPATLCLLVLGGLALIRRRRR